MVPVLLLALGIGFICGLRSMTAPAVVCWGAQLGWLQLDHSPLAFLHNKISLIVFTLFAIGELIADKLPSIPSRTQIGPLVVRIIFGAASGAALTITAGQPLATGLLAGAAGGVTGAFLGYTWRRLSAGSVPALLAALLEDVIAVGGGFLIVSRF
ncbi:DUF4126 family protein [Acidipila rosea]|uniref:Putative membrane protein n=1 Tax=Acidipila rosea TaxID=768535 RepID=A0A4R1LGD3_9BACT|nr:DUF4126 family protein [Acidipila rosea]MBW4025871.1 DUF4126 family protein [Acidobacteriota bacterium]MBW4044210.1 DUF4126 family protein [Acidobacteriota bacterium]TCK75759.1 putative membrane protein [Acidipila rosea]